MARKNKAEELYLQETGIGKTKIDFQVICLDPIPDHYLVEVEEVKNLMVPDDNTLAVPEYLYWLENKVEELINGE